METCPQTHADAVQACAAHDHSSQSYLTCTGEEPLLSSPEDPSNVTTRIAGEVSALRSSHFKLLGAVPTDDPFVKTLMSAISIFLRSDSERIKTKCANAVSALMNTADTHWLFDTLSKKVDTILSSRAGTSAESDSLSWGGKGALHAL